MSALMNDLTTHRRQQTPLAPARYHRRKPIVDRTVGALLLVVSLPVTALLVALVRGTSRGPGIYRQRRVGKDGREFWLYKIRTMYRDAEAVSGPQWAKPGDSRITPVGRALRFLHLDELPQLVNVVRGEMSLIGPRPERPEFVKRLERIIPNYRDRLLVLPGITGLAQVNLPADETIACVEKKVAIDREYIARGSAALDLRILICTALRMIGIRHGRAPRWLGVEVRLPERSASLDDTLVMSLDETLVNLPAGIANGWAAHASGAGAGGVRVNGAHLNGTHAGGAAAHGDLAHGDDAAFEYAAVAVTESPGGAQPKSAKPRQPR